ncbi:MAG: spore maturation protein [Clostridia bacterium]
MIYIVPVVILITLLTAVLKKVNIYNSFIIGTKDSLHLMLDLLPYLISIFMLLRIFQASGLSNMLSNVLATPLSYIGIPKELIELLILRPISGTGSLTILENLYQKFGVDSYVSRCASVIMASNDTILYIVAVYFSTSKDKKSGLAIPISIFATFIGAILACILCKIL